jgi:hypothetical protein
VAKKDPTVLPDEVKNGVKLFNPTRPHGVVYGDGKHEAAFVQDGIEYRADRTPIQGAKDVRPTGI